MSALLYFDPPYKIIIPLTHRAVELRAAVSSLLRAVMTEASPLTIFTTAVNFALGAGVLGLPYAMASAGIVASVLSLVTVALMSFLTCSWLLEVGDRANALQNELARLQKHRTVQHANGEVSVLPPAGEFMRSSALNEPLLEKGERKLDEYGWTVLTLPNS